MKFLKTFIDWLSRPPKVYDNKYVTFKNGVMKVDLDRWLATKEGKEQVRKACQSMNDLCKK